MKKSRLPRKQAGAAAPAEEHYQSMTVAQLREACSAAGLDAAGGRSALETRAYVRACVARRAWAGVREPAARHGHASLLAGARSRSGTGVCFLRADAGLKKELVARLAEADGDSQASPELAPRSSPRVPRTMTRSVQRAL